MERTGVIILAHGSRGERGETEVARVLEEVAGGVKALLVPGVEITGAALQFNRPGLEEAVASLVQRGVSRVVIMPYFLFSGKHITEHVPELIEKLKGVYPGRQFVVASPLGVDERFIGHVARRIEEAAPELALDNRDSLIFPGEIEAQSMAIVEKLLPPEEEISGEERVVAKRVVHASGDPEAARLIKFSPSAVSSALDAIAGGRPIFTDVRMVAAGINRRLVGSFGCALACAADEDTAPEGIEKGNVTRSAAAVLHLGDKLDGAIVAIGNAPTALLALLELIDGGAARPALVVGMPVGFVRAKEAKEELMKRDVPFISVAGTRGGSAMAAATVNALLKLAAAREEAARTGR